MGLFALTQMERKINLPQLFKRGAELVAERFRGWIPGRQPTGSPGASPAGENPLPAAGTPAAPTAALIAASQIEQILQRSKSCSEALKKICAATESNFLNLGMQLQTIQVESNALTRAVVEVLSTDQDQTIHGALQTIQTNAAEALRELNLRRSKLAEDLEGLKAIQADMIALGNQNSSFKKVAKNLKMVGLNISIESARTEEAKATFQALAEEITHLAQTVWEVAGSVGEDTLAVQQNLNAIQSEIGMRMRHLDGLIGSAEATVKNALSEVENLMQLTMHILDGIGAKAKEIGDQVGHLVVSIQIHDNISQRVAHIDLAMAEAVDLIDTAKGIDLPASAQQVVYGKVYGINRLQMAQIKTIEDDVAEVYGQSDAALSRLLSAVKALANPEGLDFSAGPGMRRLDGTNQRHPVVVLQRALEQLIALFDDGLENLRRLAIAREETGEAIARMGTHIDKVRDINFDIRLKALNAVIKSTRLGDATGKAIEAVVNEMKELAGQSNATIQKVTDIMEDIASASNSMDQSSRNDIEDVDSAGQMLRDGIKMFSQACTAFEEQSLKALEKGRQIEGEIIQVQRSTGFFNRMLAVFRKHQAELGQNEVLLQPFADAVADDWMEEEKSIVARYTMQRELDAHRRLRNGASGIEDESPAEAPPSTSAAGDDGFDDNVELF